MQNKLLRFFFLKNSLFMQKSLLRSIFFIKKYSKHLIYAKQFITIYF